MGWWVVLTESHWHCLQFLSERSEGRWYIIGWGQKVSDCQEESGIRVWRGALSAVNGSINLRGHCLELGTPDKACHLWFTSPLIYSFHFAEFGAGDLRVCLRTGQSWPPRYNYIVNRWYYYYFGKTFRIYFGKTKTLLMLTLKLSVNSQWMCSNNIGFVMHTLYSEICIHWVVSDIQV